MSSTLDAKNDTIVGPSGPVPILSLSDLMNIVDVIQANETEDKALISSLKTIDEFDVRNRIVTWAASGFPDAHVLFSFQLHKSERCSDGIVRNDVLDYYTFLCPDDPLPVVLSALEARLPGMKLTYSYTENFLICVHISKTE
jgi:hypothetical protein